MVYLKNLSFVIINLIVFTFTIGLGCDYEDSSETLTNAETYRNFTFGERMPLKDHLAKAKVIEKEYKIFGSIDVTKTFAVPENEIITQILVLDKKENGGDVSIVENGPGFNNVVLRFKSQWWRGIHFVVKVYSVKLV